MCAARGLQPRESLQSHRAARTWTVVRPLSAYRSDVAAALTGDLRRESEIRGRGPALCTALLASVIHPECPDRWVFLERALSLAAARGYVRPLLDGGQPVYDALRTGLTRGLSAIARDHAHAVLERFALPGRGDEPRGAAHLIEPLTGREVEVLGCLFAGQSNKAIGESLFVSVDTVKTHLKRIYAKLGVSDRHAAVKRSREIGLGPLH